MRGSTREFRGVASRLPPCKVTAAKRSLVKRGGLPQAPSLPCSCTSGLQTVRKKFLSAYKPSGLWYFVIAASRYRKYIYVSITFFFSGTVIYSLFLCHYCYGLHMSPNIHTGSNAFTFPPHSLNRHHFNGVGGESMSQELGRHWVPSWVQLCVSSLSPSDK